MGQGRGNGLYSTLRSCGMLSGFTLQRCWPKPFMAPITSKLGLLIAWGDTYWEFLEPNQQIGLAEVDYISSAKMCYCCM